MEGNRLKKGELEQLVLLVMKREGRPLGYQEIALLCKRPKERISQALCKLRDRGNIKSLQRGVWALSDYALPMACVQSLYIDLRNVLANADMRNNDPTVLSLRLAELHLKRALDNAKEG